MRLARVALVAKFSFEQLLWSPRTLAALLVAAAPAGLASAYRVALSLGYSEAPTAFETFSVVTAAVGFQFVAPMLALFYASGVILDDLEAGTLPYLATRPLTRTELLSGKMLGSLTLCLVLFLPSIVLAYYVALSAEGLDAIGARFGSLVLDLLAGVLGIAAYHGLFAMLGTLVSRPLLVGLFFVFGWQAGATFVPGSARYLTITHYLYALVSQENLSAASRVFGQRPGVGLALLALMAIIAVTHGVSLWRFGHREL